MNNSSLSPKKPSNTKFGWFFSALFFIITLFNYSQNLKLFAFATTLVTFIFVAMTFFAPQLLTPVNRLWFAFGIFLGKVISPIVLGAIFFVLITPIALTTRLFGRDELKIKKSFVQSHWVDRLPAGPLSDSFKNQF